MFIFRKKIISDFFKKIFSPSRSVIQSKEYLFMKSQIKVCKDILNVGSSSKTVLGKNFFKILAEDSKIINLDIKQGSNVDIVADAIVEITNEDTGKFTGNQLIDEDYLRSKGVNDFSKYQTVSGCEPPKLIDIFDKI